jgi:hypothetical protein
VPSLSAFKKLSPILRHKLICRIKQRKLDFLHLQQYGMMRHADEEHRILLVGDRPAPSAPDDPEFHYTPFGALWNSSLWINQQLENAEIPESSTAWINAHHFDGRPNSLELLKRDWKSIVVLGGNAEKWAVKSGAQFHRAAHPAYWKRFNSGLEYPLINFLNQELGYATPQE